MAVNAKDFRRALDNVDPDYLGEFDIWSVFMDGETRTVSLTSPSSEKNLKGFFGALRSPCCTAWRISEATPTRVGITLTGPESGMEITFSFPVVPGHYVSPETRWEIYGSLRDYPAGMSDRIRLSDAVAVLLGLVKLAPKDSAF